MNGRYERGLVNALDACGWGVMRAPSSGSSTQRDMPDVLAGKAMHDRVYAIELKSTSSTTAYVEADEHEALERFARKFGARPVLAAKFKRRGQRTPYWFVDPSDARMTDAGSFGVPESDVESRAFARVYAATDSKGAYVEVHK